MQEATYLPDPRPRARRRAPIPPPRDPEGSLLIVLDGSGLLQSCSRATAALLERSAEAAVGRRLGELFRFDDGRPAPDEPRTCQGRVVRLPDGRRFELAARCLGPVSAPTGALLVLQPLPDEPSANATAAAEELCVRARLGELERSNSALKGFAALVAHDLRGPARRMGCFASLLGNELEGRLSEAEAEMLRHLERSAGQMQGMIRDLLRASSADDESDRRCSIDLDALGRELGTQFEPVLRLRGSRLDWRAGGCLKAEEATLRHVLQNLIDNALRHGGPHTTVVVKLERRAEGPQFVVRDDGEGIDPADAEALFRPRSPQGDAAAGGQESLGLGLSLCRQLLEHRGGWIRTEARPSGASMRFALESEPA